MEAKDVIEPQKSKEPRAKRLRPVQFISLGFVALILVGSFLLSTPAAHRGGGWLNYADALFTATSAVCVTGLAVLDTSIHFTLFGQIVILLLIQMGGLGFMTIASILFLIIGKKITLKDRLALQEAYNQTELQGMVKLTRSVILTTLIIEGAGAVALCFSFVPALDWNWGKGIYFAIFHSISAFCNAGFDLMGATFGEFAGLTPFAADVVANLGFMALITLGGLGFTVINDVRRNWRPSRLMLQTKVVLLTTLALFLFGTIFFTAAEWNNPATLGGLDPGHKILAGMFQTVTPRTAGFATIDQAQLTGGGRLITMLYMFIGASPASTGGGVKTTTFLVLVLMIVAGAKGESEVNIRERSVNRRVAFRATAILLFAALVIGTAALSITIAEIDVLKREITIESVVFECVSAFSTVGLSMGITPELSTFSEVVLCFVMLIGRLGTLSLGLMAIAKRENAIIKYPDAKILIG